MSHIQFRCIECSALAPADARTLFCSQCHSPLEVAYTSHSSFQRESLSGLWVLDAPTPLHEAHKVVSLGEGNTPSVQLEKLRDLLGLKALYGKLEFQMPTGSFKDRGTTMLISVLNEAGVAEVVEDSSGNAGASLAAYAAKAGIAAHIFVPASAPRAKVQQIKVYGAETHLVKGSRDTATKAALAYAEDRGLCIASHNLSPYYLEGTKTFAYEVAEQFPSDLPRHIVMPVGNGSLLIGGWKGFQELLAAGTIEAMPRLHAVQAMAIRPIAAAFAGEAWTPSPRASTIAGGVSVGRPPRLNQCLRAVLSTGGRAIAVSDENIRTWQIALAQKEGIYAEPTSAVAFAGLGELVRQGHIRPGDSVLVPITGMGLKDAAPA